MPGSARSDAARIRIVAEASVADIVARKVLMIAHAFPPTGGPGVQRPAKFAKYLPLFGWNPVVWSAEHVDGLPRDESLSEDIPDEVTVHARSGGGVQSARRALRGFIAAHERKGAAAMAASQFAAAIDWRLAAWHTSHSFPDDCAAWAKKSIRPLMDLIRREGVELIFSTFSPASNHLLALELKRRTRLPWVAEFRDLWVDDCRYQAATPRKRAAHTRLQQEILDRADAVIGVTPRQTAILASYAPGQQGKFRTITNGFDPDDFADVGTAAPTGRSFVMAHVGRFDLARTRDELFSACRAFAAQLGPQKSRFLLRIVGHANSVAREKLQATGLPCEFVGYVSHAEAIRAMRSAHGLLLTVPEGENGDTIICGKLFEYLAAGRPILVVGPRDGECERIVRTCRAGLATCFESEPIVGALQELYDAWRAGRPLRGCPEDALEQFSRVELTRRLGQIFDYLSTPRASRAARGRAPRPVGAV